MISLTKRLNNLKLHDKHRHTDIKELEDQFTSPRPTPMDLVYEKDSLTGQTYYNPKAIYEWNIDGMAEYQIINFMNRMTMYCTTCKINENSDNNIAKLITTGFMGQLKGWWSNILTPKQQVEILSSARITTSIDPSTNVVSNTAHEDAVYTGLNSIHK